MTTIRPRLQRPYDESIDTGSFSLLLASAAGGEALQAATEELRGTFRKAVGYMEHCAYDGGEKSGPSVCSFSVPRLFLALSLLFLGERGGKGRLVVFVGGQ